MSDNTASCSVFLCGTSGAGAVVAAAGEIGGAPPGPVALTPGTVARGAQPAAPSYQALSVRLMVPAARLPVDLFQRKRPQLFPAARDMNLHAASLLRRRKKRQVETKEYAGTAGYAVRAGLATPHLNRPRRAASLPWLF